MKIGIFADVHSNLEALESIFKALDRGKIDSYVCLGDMVGYGPDPNLCVKKIKDITTHVVIGNHDYAALGRMPIVIFNESARKIVEWTQHTIKPEIIQYLENLPLTIVDDNITYVHATPVDPESWHYISTFGHAIQSFEAMTTSLCFVGHSHAPVAFIQNEEDEILIKNTNNLEIKKKNKYIINVGSVGQPRDGDPRSCCGIFDTDNMKFELLRIEYPIKLVQKKMSDYNFPSYLINRLSRGK